MKTTTSVRIAGGIVPSGLLERIGREDAKLSASRPTDYGLAPGERLGESITRSWHRLQPLWTRFSDRLVTEGELTGPTRQEWLLPLFDELGYGQLSSSPKLQADAKSFPISHLWGSTPIHLVGSGIDLDRRTPGAAGAARTSPHGLMQEFLNRSTEHQWGIISNGRQLRLLRDNASLTRTAYVEFDLQQIFGGDAYADFVLLWLTCHASRLQGTVGEQVLEEWRSEAAATGVRALDALRDGVEKAIEALGSAAVAHPANTKLRTRIEEGSLTPLDLYRQVLRTVYRLLFLLVAESRDLLFDPDADPGAVSRYRGNYSVARLRDLSGSIRGGGHTDLWRQHLVVGEALYSSGAPALGLAPLGGFLWSPDSIADLAEASIPNAALLDALRALTTVTLPGELPQRVDYANLGAEELGSIYESLLQYHPEINLVAQTFELNTVAGNERKSTGSYYTPVSLINELLDSALEPVVAERLAADDPESALLGLRVVDPASGSGHFLIAAANRIADHLARVRAGGDEPSPGQFRTALRDVIGHCIYAVDRNPMAVELARVAMWIEAMEPGKPLTFLDHHIVCGNSLLGTWPDFIEDGVPGEAFKALTGDDKSHVSALRKRNRVERKRGLVALSFGPTPDDMLRDLAKGISALDAMGDDTVGAVAAKQEEYERLATSAERRQLRLAADAWVAAFVTPKGPGLPEITTALVNTALHDPASVPSDIADHVAALSDQFRFHHWHIAFPDVFSGDSGFDVVLGNPPWERVKLQEKEFFASSAPDIAKAPNKAARTRLINPLQRSDPVLWQSFQDALHDAEAVSHYLRTSEVYPLCGRGDVNTYSVFTEVMYRVMGPTGRAGLVVPTGIATDDTTKECFAAFVDNNALVSLFDFENRKPIFPGVHRSYKFCLLTLTGWERPAEEAEFSFFALEPADLRDPERRFTLTPDDFALLNPNTKTCPIFRTRRDAEITKAIYLRTPVLSTDGSRDAEWPLTIRRVFDLADAETMSLILRAQELPVEERLPIVEAKLIHQFDPCFATYEENMVEETDASFKGMPTPRNWIPSNVVADAWPHPADWLLCWRDIARPNDERTLISTILPPCGTDFTLRVGFGVHNPHGLAFLCAALNAFATDYIIRQKQGGTHVADYILRQIPMIPPGVTTQLTPWDQETTLEEWIGIRFAELSATRGVLTGLTAQLGVEGPVESSDARRTRLRAELDAAFFHLYGVASEDVAYIMDTFPIVKRNDMSQHGTFLTKNLILDVYDRMFQATKSEVPYRTILDPPPGDVALLSQLESS